MLKVVFDLTEFEEVELVPIADCHVGHLLSDIQLLHDTIAYVNQEPEDPKCARICLLNGDLTESVTRNSVGNVWDMTMTPQLQVATMIEMLKPLSEPREKYPQGKILSYCGGNHDNDRYKDTGITASESIACGLGIEDRYSPDGCYSFIKLKAMQMEKKRTIIATCYNQHLTGSAGTVGGRANRIQRLSGSVFADLYVGSHFHSPLTYKEDIILPNYTKCSLGQKTMTYVLTGAFMKYGDYAQRSSMRPSTLATPRIFFKQKRYRDNCNRYFGVEVIL